ncbi:MAG TPA: cation diffusion facilitator family transporter [Thermomicrobiales bacterium]|nr:cation diffusion facilitator family transporter [Thermomicrobiales bacterium]
MTGHAGHDGDDAHAAAHLHESHDHHQHGAPAAHGHQHGPDGHGHGHEHGGGPLGRLLGAVAHAHDVADRVDESLESHERGIWALKVSLAVLLVTALIQVAIALLSGSVALLADTIHNFGDAATSIPLWIAFALARRGASRRFPYGYGRAEDVAGVAIVLVIFASACVAAYESVQKLLHPAPPDHLGWVALAAVVGFAGNEAVSVFRIRVGREIGSAALVADGQHSRVDGFTSLAVLIGVLGAWAGVPILDPLVGLAITIAILFIVREAAAAVWRRLIGGIEPEVLDRVERAARGVPGVEGVHGARARWVGHRIYADLHVAVAPDISVRQAHRIAAAAERAVCTQLRACGDVVVHVDPAGEDRADGAAPRADD